MKEIPLTQGYNAIVDDDMYSILSSFTWHASVRDNRIYAEKASSDGTRTNKLHHYIIGFPISGFVVDHINRNTLDDRRTNLRVVTKQHNCINHTKKKTSRFPGVYRRKDSGKWAVFVYSNKKSVYIGQYENEYDAFLVYRKEIISLGQVLLPEHEELYLTLERNNVR